MPYLSRVTNSPTWHTGWEIVCSCCVYTDKSHITWNRVYFSLLCGKIKALLQIVMKSQPIEHWVANCAQISQKDSLEREREREREREIEWLAHLRPVHVAIWPIWRNCDLLANLRPGPSNKFPNMAQLWRRWRICDL